jgi:hypothetical protein
LPKRGMDIASTWQREVRRDFIDNLLKITVLLVILSRFNLNHFEDPVEFSIDNGNQRYGIIYTKFGTRIAFTVY